MMNTKSMFWITLLLIAAISLGGCGGGDLPAASPGGTEAAPNAVQEGEKIFRFARSWEEASWDPALFGQADDVELALVIYETLTEIDPNGNIIPHLAESWELSEDGLTLTYHLRQGIQWHFGYGGFTSADVKFTVERHNDPAVSSKNIETMNLSNFDSIETPDDYTVVFHFKQPDPDILYRFSMCESYIVSLAAYEDIGLEGMALKPVGTGPFVYDRGTPMTQTEAVRNDNYWGEPAKIDRIVVTIIGDTNTGYTALESGQLDSISVYDIDKAQEFAAKGFNVTDIPYMELLYVSCNAQFEPFTNEQVRQAFFHAIDPQYFIDEMFYGTTEIPGSYVPPGSKYAVTDYFEPSYNPETARRLLTEAGYPNGVDVTMWAPNDALSTTPAIITQSQLQQAGFNVELQLVDFGVFIDKVRNGQAQMWLLYNTTPVIPDLTMTRYMSNEYPGRNWSGILDDEYDRLVAAGMNATTEEEKGQYFAEAQKRLMDLNIIYSISTHNFAYVTKPGVANFEVSFDGIVYLRHATIE